MKRNVLLSATLVAAAAATANADFINVTAELQSVNSGSVTYRLFANFDSPTDQLLSIGATENTAVLEFMTSTTLLNDGMSFAGLKQEDFAADPFTGATDSWVSIGATELAGNDTDYNPGFLGGDGTNSVIHGSSFSESNGGWFDSNPTSQANGSNVVIAQFTIANEADGSAGSFSLTGHAFWQPGQLMLQDDFFSVAVVPAPGVLACFGLAGLAGRRRRRA